MIIRIIFSLFILSSCYGSGPRLRINSYGKIYNMTDRQQIAKELSKYGIPESWIDKYNIRYEDVIDFESFITRFTDWSKTAFEDATPRSILDK